MAGKPTEENKYFGFTGPQAIILGIIAVVVISWAGIGPFADDVQSAVNNTGSAVPVAGASAVDVQLNSAFVSVICNTTNTVADVDTNFNDVTDVVSLQVDTNVSYAGGSSTFVMSTKDITGTTVELINYSETGTLTEPVTDQTVPMIVNIDLSVLGGFSNSDQVAYTTVSADANYLLDTAGVKFYPILARTTDSTNPSVKVDTVLDTKSFAWLASTATQSPDVTFDLSWIGVNKMDDISDKVTVQVVIEGGDDTPIDIEIIRNDAIIT